MPSKFVFVTEIKTDKTKAGKDYFYILDQEKIRWNFFQNEKLELQKGYVFDYEESNGYQNVKAIKPVVNVFHQKALAETANRNDYKRDYSIAITQAIQFIGADNAKLDDVFLAADKIYQRVNQVADDEMAKVQSEGKNDQTK